jgi:hypothetical protein
MICPKGTIMISVYGQGLSTDRPTYSSGRHINLPGIFIIEANVSTIEMTNVSASIGLSNI